MVHSKKIFAAVTTTKLYEDYEIVMHENREFIIPQFDIDTNEDQDTDVGISIACTLAQDTKNYEGLPESSRPYSIIYFVECEKFTLPVRFIYSEEYKCYADCYGKLEKKQDA